MKLIYSYSRLSLYESCPYRFYQKYVLGKQEPETEPMITGKIVHEAIETMVKNVTPIDLAIDKAMAPWEAHPEGSRVNRQDVFWMTKRGNQRVADYLPDKKLELHLTASALDDPFVESTVQGYIDIMDSRKLGDWKTGRLKANPMQVKLYLWLAHENGFQLDKGFLYDLRFGKNDLEMDNTPEVREEARTWAADLISEIDQKLIDMNDGDSVDSVFPAKCGSACQYCSFVKTCTAFTQQYAAKPKTLAEIKSSSLPTEEKIKLLEELAVNGKIEDDLTVEKPQDAKDAEQAAREIVRLEALLKVLKSNLKEFVEKNGDVVVDNKKFTLIESSSWQWSAEGIERFLAEIKSDELNPYEYLSISATDLKKIKKKADIDDASIAKFASTKKSKMFKMVSAEEPA